MRSMANRSKTVPSRLMARVSATHVVVVVVVEGVMVVAVVVDVVVVVVLGARAAVVVAGVAEAGAVECEGINLNVSKRHTLKQEVINGFH